MNENNHDDFLAEAAQEYWHLKQNSKDNAATELLNKRNISLVDIQPYLDPLQILKADDRLSKTRDANSSYELIANGSCFGPPISKNNPRQRYEILEHLGGGAFANVYKAVDLAGGTETEVKIVAIKVFHSRNNLRHFLREISTIQSLNHPNIIKIESIPSDHESGSYYTMEFVENARDLKQVVESGELSCNDAVAIVSSIAKAVSYMHSISSPVIHRDIKPSNILISDDGGVRLIDFGLAKSVFDQTQNTRLEGTPLFLPPECILGGSHVPESDVYSLGATLFYLLTKKHHVHGDFPKTVSEGRTLATTRPNEMVSARKHNPSVPKKVDLILAKSLMHEIDARYDAELFAQDLEAYLTDKPVSVSPKGPLDHCLLWRRKNPILARRLTWSVSGVAILAMVCSAFFLQRGYFLNQNNFLTDKIKDVRDANWGQIKKIAEVDRSLTSTARELLIAKRQRYLDQARSLIATSQYDKATIALQQVPIDVIGAETIAPLTQMPHLEQFVIGQHDYGVSASLFCLEKSSIVSAGYDGNLCFWDEKSPSQNNMLVTGDWSQTALKHKAHLPWSGNTSPKDFFTSLAWVKPGETFLGGTYYGRLVFWDLASPISKTTIEFQHEIRAIKSSSDEKMALCGFQNGSIALVDLINQTVSKKVESKGKSVRDIERTDFGWLVAYVDGEIELLDVETLGKIAKLECGFSVWDIEFNQDQSKLFVAGVADTISAWMFDSTFKKFVLSSKFRLSIGDTNEVSAFNAVSYDAQSERLFAGSEKGSIVCWEIPKVDKPVFHLKDRQGNESMFADKMEVPLRFLRRYVRIYPKNDPNTFYSAGINGSLRKACYSHNGPVQLRLSPGAHVAFDGNKPSILWELTDSGSVRVWDIKTLSKVGQLNSQNRSISHMLTSKGGVLVADANGVISRLSIESGEVKSDPILDHGVKVIQLSSHMQQDKIAVLDQRKTLALFGLNGELICKTNDIPSDIGQMEFDFSGDFLALRFGLAGCDRYETNNLKKNSDLSSLFNTSGSTLICANPYLAGEFIGGNGDGNVYGHPTHKFKTGIERSHDSVIGIDFVKTTIENETHSRRIIARRNGTIRFYDGEHAGVLFQLKSPDKSRPTQLVKNCDDSKFSMVHENGTVAIWMLSQQSKAKSAEVRHEETLLRGKSAENLRFGSAPIITKNGSYFVLFSRKIDGEQDEVVLARWTLGRWFESYLGKGDWENSERQVEFSMFHCVSGSRIFTSLFENSERNIEFYSHPFDFKSDNNQLGIPVAVSGECKVGDPVKILDLPSGPQLFMHDNAGYYLTRVSGFSGSSNVTMQRLGRQGDGMRFETVNSKSGMIDLLFLSKRTDEDGNLPYVYRIDSSTGNVVSKVKLDDKINLIPAGIHYEEESGDSICFLVDNDSDGQQVVAKRVCHKDQTVVAKSLWRFAKFETPYSINFIPRTVYGETAFTAFVHEKPWLFICGNAPRRILLSKTGKVAQFVEARNGKAIFFIYQGTELKTVSISRGL